LLYLKNLNSYFNICEDYENDVNAKQFINFIDKGGNILLTANENTGNAIEDLLYEFGATVDESGFNVIDNFAHNGTTPNVLAIEELDYPISLDKLEAPVLYSGTAIKSNGKNPYAKPVLVAGPAAYSWDETAVTKAPLVTGNNIILVHTLQAINNSRIVMTGSNKMFTDKLVFLLPFFFFFFFKKKKKKKKINTN